MTREAYLFFKRGRQLDARRYGKGYGMHRRWLLLFVVLLGGALVASCTQSGSTRPATSALPGQGIGQPVNIQGGTYTDITPVELQAMLGQKDFTFVNVHIPYEGDIAQTDVSIPYNQIGGQLGRLPADKGAKIVLYCRSGRMSTEAAQALVKLGYTNVFQLAGGLIAWEKAGYPISLKP